ncbi:MAG: hypothetical protein AB1656_16920 [Candidatus Omnitrophota bacterium]
METMTVSPISRRRLLIGGLSAFGALGLSNSGLAADSGKLSEDRRRSLMLALEEMEPRYDPQERMVKSSVSKVGYHTTLSEGTVHPTRESLTYAAALLDSGKEKFYRRAEDILRRTISLQDQNHANKTYGIWSWYLEEPLDKMSPPDWNWADFCGVQLLAAWIGHHDRLSGDLAEQVRESILHAAESIKRRNVSLGYTNIAVMGTYVVLAAAEQFGVKPLEEYARDRLRRLHAYILEQGTLAEYNSPTYTIVALAELSRMLLHLRNEEDRSLVNDIHNLAWKHAAIRFHPPTRQWAGPHSRCYSTDLRERKNYLAFLEAATGNQRLISKENPLPLGLDYYRLPIHCPQESIAYYAKLDEPRNVIETFAKGKTPVIGMTYLHHQFAFGSVNHGDFWNQRRPFLAYWGTGEKPAYLQLRFLHDGYDFCSAIPFTAQKKGAALTTVLLATNYGDAHPSLDKVKNGTIKAKDLRLRFEFGAEIGELSLPASIDPQKEIVAADRNIRIIIKPLSGRFGDEDFRWETGGNGEKRWIDAVAWSGEERNVDLSRLGEAHLTFAFLIAPQEESAISFSSAQTKVANGRLQAAWTIGEETLNLECLAKPDELNALRDSFWR